jgi:translation initiation factor 2B subunit (eIF-2B alpha/beta/delta family)
MTAEHLLREIALNNRDGAAEILQRAVKLFELLAAQVDDPAMSSQTRNATIEACAGLVRAQPRMAPLINLANAVIRAADSALSESQVLKVAAGAASEFTRQCSRAVTEASANAAGLIRDGARVLTHSRSSTILRTLIDAHNAGTNFSVIATESRPLLEGRTLAEALSRQGLHVTLIADAAVALVLDTVTCVLVGADRVTPLVLENKIGTRLIALAAAEQRVPVYAVADSSKFINPPDPRAAAEAERPPDELWPDTPYGVLILNRYFEETSLRHFTGIITEEGVLRPEEARRRAEAAVIDPSLWDAIRGGVIRDA